MRIPKEKLSEIAAAGPKIARGQKGPSLDRLVAKLRRDIRAEISEHMQAWMILLDESVKFFIHFEQYQYSRKLTAQTSPFALQISQIRSTILSIRELVLIGQESSAQALSRVFVDDVELSMALAEDPSFAQAYVETDNDSVFWKRHIGYGNIYPRVERFIRRGIGSEEECVARLSHHRAMKTFLSGDIHGSSASALRVALPPSLAKPGFFHAEVLGAVSTNLPHLCFFLADEAHLFASCCINLFISPEPPPALAGYEPTDALVAAIASAHMLQELIARFGEELKRKQAAITDAVLSEQDSAWGQT